ncbi:response regulator transcription factor [Staphylococcus borealis]|uniref:response regulator transcription factor n=1 Tax=Staphylococcus borealis TaxID=2742203 RepID=UPI000D1EF22A|nr:helix-turn-helix domain-containing protein [Staphylococcus borealis]MCQ9278741.1 helix-turn-helix domain-containing protein [Staphylococcus borealis]PTK67774.1 DNA-binding response regulator [Staphylococcus borealis]RIO71967.1 helix-turn-helix domain-containing protein [Staphylococcus borealis]
MYKVVICDSDYNCYKNLKKNIPWEKFHFNSVYYANDGLEGLKLIKDYLPELLITDINIPNIEGVTLLENANQYNCSTVIISKQKNFECLKAGIKYNSIDYLSKPLDYKELEDLLAQFVTQLNTDSTFTFLDVFSYFKHKKYNNYYINKILDYIHNHFFLQIQIKNIAALLQISESYMMRLFKNYVGISIVDYINRYRIFKSLNLLASSYKLYEISEKVGFTHYKLYNYHFRKYLGISPKHFKTIYY